MQEGYPFSSCRPLLGGRGAVDSAADLAYTAFISEQVPCFARHHIYCGLRSGLLLDSSPLLPPFVFLGTGNAAVILLLRHRVGE